MKKRNVILVTLAEVILLVIAYVLLVLMSAGSGAVVIMIHNIIDIPSLIYILIFTLPGLAIAGVWKDFWKAFTVGQKEYSLKELKNMSEAVKVGKKLPVLGGIFAIMIGLLAIFYYLDFGAMEFEREVFVANIAVAMLPIIYVTVIEFLLIPVSVNLAKTINEVMSFDEEE